jgi:hypothetical protein
MKYRKKPVVIEAMQWKGRVNCDEAHDFIGLPRCSDGELNHDRLHIPTLEGTMTARPGDWIIKGVQGEFYPCKPDIFEATYEPVEESR